MLFGVTTEQIAVRVASVQLAGLDELVDHGVYPSRAAAVRAGIEAVVELHRRRRAAIATVEGYRRTPPTIAEDATAIASLREATVEEPW